MQNFYFEPIENEDDNSQSCSTNKSSCCSSNNDSAINLENHWDEVYSNKISEETEWYEENPSESLELIAECNLNKDAAIFIAGAGLSTMIEKLIDLGYTNITACDISSVALEKLEKSLGEKSSNVNFIHGDLTDETLLDHSIKFDLWHDRAVMHFLNEKNEIDSYFKLLKKSLNENASVILAPFNERSVDTCSGLNVNRHNLQSLQNNLGEEFKLMRTFDKEYISPAGNIKQFIYTLFKSK